MNEWNGQERRLLPKRRAKRVYRFIDRRSGFDRRGHAVVLGTMRDHPWILVAVLIVLNVLSLLDGFFTAAELGLGIASEGNPLLDAVARHNPLFAVAVKVGAMLLVSVGIWHGRRTRAILALSLISLGLFAAIVAYHVGSLTALGWL